MLRSELRYAIWVAHGKRDAYSGDRIENFKDLEIDHIIPRSTDKILLQEKISKYDLGADFSLNSLGNLLPTSKLLNRQKSHSAFNESFERFYLAYAQEKKAKVEEECKKAIKNRKLKEKAQFGKSYSIVDHNEPAFNPSYFNSDTLIVLNALLPSKFIELGSCAIEFYEVSNMVALNHDQILHLIERSKEYTLEEVILHYYSEKSETAFVIIGTSSLHLKNEAYNQLVTILKDFLRVYVEFLPRFKTFMGIGNLELYKSRECYRMMTITAAEWDFLVSYAAQNDHDSSNNNSFYFSSTPKCLIAINSNDPIIVFTLSPVFKRDEVTLIWHLPHKYDRKFVEDDKVWTAQRTLNWLLQLLENIKSPTTRKQSETIKGSIFSRIRNSFR
ncbi:GmrSD restriction endonuclease domain-containing protein [Mucilaginibacter sp. SP1R1]|uniref:GmrSD restriction endonuclease domain-containing protein n=1 Tax=Mucilaginibacter sp. SP1R1 TaxID=2723091 RepID=UPI001613380E|nr:DUF1524 domain-containing protein [Mucilaginibacter sp. SP1R1]MBB6151781.1 hypothetical protein [Mucilaginibacter sp. SP1R1]